MFHPSGTRTPLCTSLYDIIANDPAWGFDSIVKPELFPVTVEIFAATPGRFARPPCAAAPAAVARSPDDIMFNGKTRKETEELAAALRASIAKRKAAEPAASSPGDSVRPPDDNGGVGGRGAMSRRALSPDDALSAQHEASAKANSNRSADERMERQLNLAGAASKGMPVLLSELRAELDARNAPRELVEPPNVFDKLAPEVGTPVVPLNEIVKNIPAAAAEKGATSVDVGPVHTDAGAAVNRHTFDEFIGELRHKQPTAAGLAKMKSVYNADELKGGNLLDNQQSDLGGMIKEWQDKLNNPFQ